MSKKKDRTLFERLLTIQSELKAPKSQYNEDGNYNYRSSEDILEAVKPLLLKEGLLLKIDTAVIKVGKRYYIKATVRLFLEEKSICISAWARETEQEEGMNQSQTTGSASSYARKNALGQLFLLDDSDNEGENKLKITGKVIDEVEKKINEIKTVPELTEYYKFLNKNGTTSIEVVKQMAKRKSEILDEGIVKMEEDGRA